MFPAWINIDPVTYPIVIHPNSPIDSILYPEFPPDIESASYLDNETITTYQQPVAGVIYG